MARSLGVVRPAEADGPHRDSRAAPKPSLALVDPVRVGDESEQILRQRTPAGRAGSAVASLGVASIGHLARRFFGSLSRRPPAPADDAWARQHLLPGELAVWEQMSAPDRRHSVGVARRTAAALGPDSDRAVIAAALLHDCGKLDAGLGTLARVGATAYAGVVGRPRAGRGHGRIGRYLQHEELGAQRLSAAGSDPITVALVRADDDAPPAALAALRAADDE